MVPHDIAIRRVSVAPEGFDARFSAQGRRYAYRLSDRADTRDPLTRGFVAWYPHQVDVDVLNRAAATLTGLRDFSAFCRARPGATTVRELERFSWERPEDGADAGLVVATLAADAFCHSMVRSLVGAVIDVGRGRRDLGWLERVAAHRVRAQAVKVAVARGLTLEEVVYPDDAALGARAALTRARRSLD